MTATNPMKVLFEQVEIAANSGLYYLALFGALVIPDMCGALDSDDGVANRSRYIAWFDRHVSPKYVIPATGKPSLTGLECYLLRSSMLHLGSGMSTRSHWTRIHYFPHDRLHNFVLEDCIVASERGNWLHISIPEFCKDVTSSALDWLAAVEHSASFEKNSPRFLALYLNGIKGFKGLFIA